MEWIPVEERLPQECEQYLVTAYSEIMGGYTVYLDMYIPQKKKFCLDNVTAWAEVPNPYKPE